MPARQNASRPAAVVLCLLGYPRLLRDGVELTPRIKYRKGLALLAYLGAQPGVWCTREALAELLWPGLAPAAARTNLRQVLNNLAQTLDDGGHFLQKRDAAVRLEPGTATDLPLDMALLSDEALNRVKEETPAARRWRTRVLEPRLAQLAGPFCEGFELPDTPEFSTWLQARRGYVHSRVELLLEALCSMQQLEGRLSQAIETARQLLGVAPHKEAHQHLLMTLLAASGEARAALAVFDTYALALRRDLGVAPGERLQALREEIGRKLKDTETLAIGASTHSAELRQLVGVYCHPAATASDSLRAGFVAQVKAVVEPWGGRVVSTLGRGVLAVFGLERLAERAGQRAFLAAQALLALPAEGGVAVGVSAGQVLLYPSSDLPHWGGDMLDVARLVGWSAQPGEVLADANAALLGGEWFDFSDAGPRLFPGAQAATPLLRLCGAAALPGGHITSPLVGRADELAQLNQAWHAVGAGQACVVVLRAPPGLGKTSLADAFATQVEASQGRVRRIQCRLEHQHEALFPVLAEAGIRAESTRFEALSKNDVFDALIADFCAQAATRPTLLLVDDLHWSDLATRELLGQLVRGLDAQPLLLLATTRPEIELDFPAERCTLIDLAPLDHAGSLSMIGAHDPQGAIAAAEREGIAEVCGGIPLFVERQVKARLQGGHHWLSISTLLQGELDKLGPYKPVLSAAAVLGNQFERSHLAQLLPEADIAAALARASQLQLIETPWAGSCRFRHALIRDAAYESLPAPRRRALHEAAARLLMRHADSPAAELAGHLERADCAHEAAAWWAKAGEQDMQKEFAGVAMVSFGKAIALLEAQNRETDRFWCNAIRIRLGYASQMAHGLGAASTYELFSAIVAELQARPDECEPGQLFAALSGCYMGASSLTKEEGLALAHRLESLARTDAEWLMASFALGNTLFWLGRFAEAAQWQQKCMALAETVAFPERIRYTVDDPAVTSRALHAWTLCYLGQEAQALAMAEEAVARGRRGRRAHALCFAMMLATCMHFSRNDTARAGQLAADTLSLARQYRFPLWEAGAGLLHLWALAESGQLATTEELLGAATQLRQAIPSRANTSRWFVIRALMAQGEPMPAEELLDVALREVETMEEQYCWADLLWLKSRSLRLRGQSAEAEACAQAARSLAQQQQRVEPTALQTCAA